MAPHALIPLAQGCEDLEAVTIIDVLRRADIQVTTAGLDQSPVIGSRKTTFIPDTTLDQVLNTDFDLIALPGGLPGSDHLNNDARIHKLLLKTIDNKRYVAAICAAPKVLATAGILNHKKATCFPGALDLFNSNIIQVCDDAVVVDGLIITSRSAGTALDFALTLVGILLGKDKQQAIDNQLKR